MNRMVIWIYKYYSNHKFFIFINIYSFMTITITAKAIQTKDGYYIGEYVLLDSELEEFGNLLLKDKVTITADVKEVTHKQVGIQQCREGIIKYLVNIRSIK